MLSKKKWQKKTFFFSPRESTHHATELQVIIEQAFGIAQRSGLNVHDTEGVLLMLQSKAGT